MRLGSPVYDWQTPGSWVDRHHLEGLGAAYWPLPLDAPAAQVEGFAAAARERNLVIAEVGIWNNLLDRDESARERNFQQAALALALADRIGARCAVNIAGSYSPTWDGPHPDNFSERAFEEIVSVTRRLLDTVRPTRTRYALECMPWVFPYDADSMQRLLEAVDHPAFGVHVDMVNLVSGADKIYRTGELTRDFFERFGPKICSVHAKDVVLRAEFTTHIDEALPGEGLFDLDALLRCCTAQQDLPVMCEHLPGYPEYHQAVCHLQRRADALGLSYDVAEAAGKAR